MLWNSGENKISTTEINSIIENGLTPEDVENNGGYATLNYDSFWVDVCCADDKVNAELHVMLDYKFTFTQGCSYFLNSFATDWEIYKYCISFSFVAESKQELENVLLHCVEYF